MLARGLPSPEAISAYIPGHGNENAEALSKERASKPFTLYQCVERADSVRWRKKSCSTFYANARD